MDLNQTQIEIIETLMDLLNVVSIFVVIVLTFLIIYANHYLIKKRSSEIALYMLLGMSKQKITRITIYETFCISIISLVSGIIFGIFISQILMVVTANLFEVKLQFQFVFSDTSMTVSILAFLFIFFCTCVWNTFLIKRSQLINMMQANKKMQEFKLRKISTSVFVFIVSICLLGYAYYQAFFQGLDAFEQLHIIIVCGSLGTILFFLSLAGFMLSVIKQNKKIYYKGLRCFMLRQIHANININFISMSVVCIMLLMSIGALSTGFSLSRTLNNSFKESTPYDYTYTLSYYHVYGNEKNDIIPDNATQLIKDAPLNQSLIKNGNYATIYANNLNINDPLFRTYYNKYEKRVAKNMKDSKSVIIPLSDFNKERTVRGYEPIHLKSNETYAYSTVEFTETQIQKIIDHKPDIKLYEQTFQIKNDEYRKLSIGTSAGVNLYSLAFVIPDAQIPQNATPYEFYYNLDLNKNVTIKAFEKDLRKQVQAINEKSPVQQSLPEVGTSREKVESTSVGFGVIFTYIGIYLGIIFLLSSAVILALQQLSQANVNKQRYEILSKIGCDKKMICRSIFQQIALYFMMPLLLAGIHSYVGIHLINEIITTMGKPDVMFSSLMSGGIILIIYGTYFLITYISYKRMIYQK